MRLLMTAFLFSTLTVFPALADTHDVFGTFLIEDGTALVKIEDCGDGSPCGTIVWIEPETLNANETIETVVGKNGEPVLSAQILWGFSKGAKNWRKGKIYNTENDKTYAARLKRLDNRTLQLKGCIGPVCQTQIWTQFE